MLEVVGTVLSVAQTLFAALQNEDLKDFLSRFGYKSQLEDLQRTVTFIQAAFRDAERKKNLSEVQKQLLQELKDAVYEADDLLDEFVTLAEQNQLLEADGRFLNKLRSFLSGTNPFVVANKMSKGVKKIREKLDAIAYNNQFCFVHDPEPISNRRPETCPYVNEVVIIGREEDQEKIIGMLLNSNDQQDLSFLSIFGIGGLGKTALAQLVYNDPRAETAFSLRMWACVSDQDQERLDVKEVLGKILASMNLDEGSTLVQKQSKLQQQLAGKRYLLVLDDVWTEDREAWRDLVQYFVGGLKGSWIVVTTRSKRTATIIGDKDFQMYELQGLSKIDSRRLFDRIAFGSNESNPPPDDGLIKLGQEIVDGCARVPLAIRVIGSLLYRQDKSKWESVKDIGFSNISKKEDGIMSILELSYHHLESPLKSCFAYCALFPKDFEIQKEMLIDLWIAQGYVVPFYEGQNVENAGEEYFSILLKRCFFQDIEKDELGEIETCKMHDLIHDIAQSVSGKDIKAENVSSVNINEKIRHFSISSREYRIHSLHKTHARSYIQLGATEICHVYVENSFAGDLISRCASLRALSFAGLVMKNLPDSLSTLLHLRYLNLSYNEDLEILPKSITKLYNLQILKLIRCLNLKELPKDLSKLVKLRALDISFCHKLKYMPRGMEKLTCLHRLSDFIVKSERNSVNWKQWSDGLESLKGLNNLKGGLRVCIVWPEKADNADRRIYFEKRCILRSKEHLNHIQIDFEDEEGDGKIDDEISLEDEDGDDEISLEDEDGDGEMDDETNIALMEDLQPHPNLKRLVVRGYNGRRMPNWVTFLPNLVELQLQECKQLKEWLGGGRVEVGDASNSSGNNESHLQPLPCLPQLKVLKINNCPELTWVPLCPKLELLCLERFNKELVIGEVGQAYASTYCHKLKEIKLDNVAWLKSQPMEAFQCLEKLEIWKDEEVEKLGEIKEVFRSCSSSLRILYFFSCPKLRSVVGEGLEHLTTLEGLYFFMCDKLFEEEEEEGEDSAIMSISCPSLLPSLRFLNLYLLRELENLPNWMQFLTALQTLKIKGCTKLKAMPNWMPKLTSLKHLDFLCSKSLERRCEKELQGEDWPFIQHIPTITFLCSDGYN